MKVFVHETAVVDEGAQIGANSKVWHFSHVCAGAKIGSGVSLGQNVFVGNNVVIGDNCKIQNNVSIYDNVFLEADVFCGPSVVFTNVLNPRAHIPRKKEYRSTFVRRGVSLGANSTIVCGVNIESYAFIAAGACVTKHVKAYALMMGVPAAQKGWIDRRGDKLPFPLQGHSKFVCPITADEYEIIDKEVFFTHKKTKK